MLQSGRCRLFSGGYVANSGLQRLLGLMVKYPFISLPAYILPVNIHRLRHNLLSL